MNSLDVFARTVPQCSLDPFANKKKKKTQNRRSLCVPCSSVCGVTPFRSSLQLLCDSEVFLGLAVIEKDEKLQGDDDRG